MDKRFNSTANPLDQMLNWANVGTLQLPDFQRGWVWDDDHISSLLASISLNYPIGAVMTLQTGNPEVQFLPRPIEGVELDGKVEPSFLLLDGQQRMTSLYLALKSEKPVPTRDSRGKKLNRHYYADMRKCVHPFADREEAIFSVPDDRQLKAFGGGVTLDVSSRDLEYEQEMFPLDIILDYSKTMDWQLGYFNAGPGEYEDRLHLWQEFNRIINAFVQYQVPAIELDKSTPKEAVCQVFEKVNTGGVSLTVFELLTATFAIDTFNLREDWQKRREVFKEYPALSGFEATDFLQCVTLLVTYERRKAFLEENQDPDKAPAVSCKRRDILKLTFSEYQKWADVVTDALQRAVPFLHKLHIFKSKDLPYATQLVPLGAALAALGDKAESHSGVEKLKRWFWCGVFGEMYGGSTETRFALDLPDLVDWFDGGEEPRTVRDAQFQAERLLTLRTRNSAAYKGLHALQMARGARDFRTGSPIDVNVYFDDAVDIHHIFPVKWCNQNGFDSSIYNSAVNKAPIDAQTNRQIGGRAPSEYLDRIESAHEMEATELDTILRSHDIQPEFLRSDDFPSFFNTRFERLIRHVEQAMNKPVNRTPDRSESPFSDVHSQKEVAARIQSTISDGEGILVEFKSTGRKNLHTGEKDPKIEWSLLKTIAAFANGHGGTVLVGVADDGSVVGIEEDYPFVKSADPDGWQHWLGDAVKTSMGVVAASDLDVVFAEIDGRTVARLSVAPAAQPVFAVPSMGDGKPLFMVRITSSTQELMGEAALDYQKKRWPGQF